MKISAFGMTDVGKKRSHNEDSFLVNDDLRLFVVADGMGGHSGGEFASRFAVSTVEEVLQGMNEDPEATVISGVNSDDASYGERLRYAIGVASQKIYEQALFDESLRGMGTTVAAVLMDSGKASVAHVGDSRVYLIRDGQMKVLTEDHSLVTEQMKAGVITEKDAKNHRYKNVITRSVGYQGEVEVDVAQVDLSLHDKILICSDGLTNMIEDDVICSHVVGNDVKAACENLIRLANENGGEDNITVVLCEVVEDSEDTGDDWVMD
jgi:serine/threonine protein phosphatase PrpC